MKIVIVDYGMGNICSLLGALNFVGFNQVIVSNQEQDILEASRLILPGVGAFNYAMHHIKKTSLDVHLKKAITQKKIPVLGICLGMQLLGKSSIENGFCEGLGFIDGTVNILDAQKAKVPHVGFNQVLSHANSRLYKNLPNLPDFYFTHSYKMVSSKDIGQSYCDYGAQFIASFENENIAGVQFHPELSQHHGLRLLKNFIELF